MILIIYEECDLSTVNFIDFCTTNGYEFIAIKIDDLISDDVCIIDTQDKCIWVVKNQELDLKRISGVYLRTLDFKSIMFDNYKKSDRAYVKQEWWSYFIYRTSTIQNCINPLTLELISSLISEIPFFLRIASEVGFCTPEYIFSTSHQELEGIFYKNKKYIAQSSLFAVTDFRASTILKEDTIGLVEYIKGRPIFVHIIDDNIFCCMHHKCEKLNIELTSLEKEKCLSIAKKTNLRVLQIILIEQEHTMQRFFINLSIYPNWDLNHNENICSIYQSLVAALNKG